MVKESVFVNKNHMKYEAIKFSDLSLKFSSSFLHKKFQRLFESAHVKVGIFVTNFVCGGQM